MSRRLIVMRHAKSSWTSGARSDHERPLNKRGRRDAPRVAKRLRKLDWTPERVISSDATRTRETWARMAHVLGDDLDTIFTNRLYHGGFPSLEEELADQDDVRTILVLGHNPGWEEVVAFLSGDYVRMTTANAALLEHIGDDWLGAVQDQGAWELIDVIRPKEL